MRKAINIKHPFGEARKGLDSRAPRSVLCSSQKMQDRGTKVLARVSADMGSIVTAVRRVGDGGDTDLLLPSDRRSNASHAQ